MPRTLAIAAYAFACVIALAGGFIAGAIHAATERGDRPPAIGVPPDDRDAIIRVLAEPFDSPATPPMP